MTMGFEPMNPEGSELETDAFDHFAKSFNYIIYL